MRVANHDIVEFRKFRQMMEKQSTWTLVSHGHYEAGQFLWYFFNGVIVDTETGRLSEVGHIAKWIELGHSPEPAGAMDEQ